MFVTGLLNDWKRMLEDAGRRRHDNNGSSEEFLAHQRSIWTPPELYEKCCPRWLAGGGRSLDRDPHHAPVAHHRRNPSHSRTGGISYTSHPFGDNDSEYLDSGFVRLKNGSWTCPGCCNRLHPTVTLFFEGGRTVAILTSRLDPFVNYLDGLVADGSAARKTPFYYELDGFLRENLDRLRKKQDLFGSHLVNVAMGAMDRSDNAHRRLLEEEYRTRRLRRTGGRAAPPLASLEEVLEICRLHRLGDDLDVLSIYCMQRTSRTFRKISDPMARDRMERCQLVVSPLVDGYYVSGYSVFRRGATSDPDDRRLSLERENGRLVEYAVAPQIVLKRDRTDLVKFAPLDEIDRAGKSKADESEDGSLPTNNAGSSSFSWSCEELSFANLEREWGDIGVHEYVGQKVLVQWRRSEVDVADNTDIEGSKSSSSTADLTIYDLGIPSRVGGARRLGSSFSMGHSSAHFSFQLVVDRMEATQVDEVTVSFQGSARIASCRMNFRYLVAEYARSLEPCLTARHQQIERTRPLLEQELAYLKEVREAMSMGSRSS
jgi:hypothetical protein